MASGQQLRSMGGVEHLGANLGLVSEVVVAGDELVRASLPRLRAPRYGNGGTDLGAILGAAIVPMLLPPTWCSTNALMDKTYGTHSISTRSDSDTIIGQRSSKSRLR